MSCLPEIPFSLTNISVNWNNTDKFVASFILLDKEKRVQECDATAA